MFLLRYLNQWDSVVLKGWAAFTTYFVTALWHSLTVLTHASFCCKGKQLAEAIEAKSKNNTVEIILFLLHHSTNINSINSWFFSAGMMPLTLNGCCTATGHRIWWRVTEYGVTSALVPLRLSKMQQALTLTWWTVNKYFSKGIVVPHVVASGLQQILHLAVVSLTLVKCIHKSRWCATVCPVSQCC